MGRLTKLLVNECATIEALTAEVTEELRITPVDSLEARDHDWTELEWKCRALYAISAGMLARRKAMLDVP